MSFETEFAFTLPRGYLDSDGNLHRDGVMRLATAFDEIGPMKDPRVQANPGYLLIILLSRVITKLGDLSPINPKVMESLYSADLAYLQDFYRRINYTGHNRLEVACPHCEKEFEVEVVGLGVASYPSEALHEEVAYIAQHFHWPYDQIMNLDHRERRRWVTEIERTYTSNAGQA